MCFRSSSGSLQAPSNGQRGSGLCSAAKVHPRLGASGPLGQDWRSSHTPCGWPRQIERPIVRRVAFPAFCFCLAWGLGIFFEPWACESQKGGDDPGLAFGVITQDWWLYILACFGHWRRRARSSGPYQHGS